MADLKAFSQLLCEAIVAGWIDFIGGRPEATPYALAIIGGQSANYLGFAVATEEGLREIAGKYDNKGYRFQSYDGETADNLEKLAAWLRWANPDDGWIYMDFPERFNVQGSLDDLSQSGLLGTDGEELEEVCAGVLAALQDDLSWKEVTRGAVIVGFTYGEDPRDFLRTATRANPYPLVKKLWKEQWIVDELAPLIKKTNN